LSGDGAIPDAVRWEPALDFSEHRENQRRICERGLRRDDRFDDFQTIIESETSRAWREALKF
jgi:hypothetical protein